MMRKFMAFQADIPFATFLRVTAKTATVTESAPATNFLLEERLPALHEAAFLDTAPDVPAKGWDPDLWRLRFGNHYSEKIALPQSRAQAISTFAASNRDNHLVIESHQDVVRVESLVFLFGRHATIFDSIAELVEELRAFIELKNAGRLSEFDDDRRSRLSLWIDELNARRDARPAFATPLGEVEALLSAPDWAKQLRNTLGLAHLTGTPTKPLPILLCRYNLARVEKAAAAAKLAAWAAIPTVLDAGGTSGPGAAFFPYPEAAETIHPFKSGVIVNLAMGSNLDFRSELLHSRLEYTLDDFAMVGEITDDVSEKQLFTARQEHFALLEQDFKYRSDVL